MMIFVLKFHYESSSVGRVSRKDETDVSYNGPKKWKTRQRPILNFGDSYFRSLFKRELLQPPSDWEISI